MIYKPEHADRLSDPVPVYRHAQPASVAPDALIKAVDFISRLSVKIRQLKRDPIKMPLSGY